MTSQRGGRKCVRLGGRRQKKRKKLAPIFRRAAGDATDSGDDGGAAPVVERELTEVERELLRIRQEFLRSGVPEELRKQAAANQSVAATALDYPPWPSRDQIHVMQQVCDVTHDMH